MTVVTGGAHGKVLVLGGYTILDPQYQGLVLAVSAKFNSTFSTPAKTSDHITITSSLVPRYSAPWDRWRHPNSFIQNAVTLAVEVSSTITDGKSHLKGFDVHLDGGSEFYTGTGKTGLGSSAALVVSLVAAILRGLGVVLPRQSFASLVHNVSQAAHCRAQGRIGSGFDISCACFGSQAYKRFCADQIMEFEGKDLYEFLIASSVVKNASNSPTHDDPSESISSLGSHVDQFALPPRLELFLCDVEGGSATPSMVRRVLEWKSDNPVESKALFDALSSSNNQIIELFAELRSLYQICNPGYHRGFNKASSMAPSEWIKFEHPIIRVLGEVREEFIVVRQLLKALGNAAGAAVEPDQQSDILDQTMDVPGVLMSGVPGAGGFDAIFCIAITPANNYINGTLPSNIQNLWASLGNLHQLPVKVVDTGFTLTSDQSNVTQRQARNNNFSSNI